MGMAPKVAVIGHMVPTPTSLAMPEKPAQRENLLKVYNYTRVLTDERKLVDHIAYLKRNEIGAGQRHSVWEMYLCATLLLKSHLARHGVETLMVNYVDSDNEKAEMSRLRDFGPDIVILSTTFVLGAKHLADATAIIRRALPNAYIVAGGHHVFTTLMYLDDVKKAGYLKTSKLDAFVNDVQGEDTLLKLVRAWPDKLTEVPNLVWRNAKDEISVNQRAVENNDINSTLINFDGIEPGCVVHIRTARSCAFTCAFCSYPTIAGDLALMEIENAIATVRRAKEAGASALFFVDDTFNVPQKRFETLIDRLIEENIGLPWYSFLRCQFVDEALVEKMSRSGCRGVFLGIESGSDRILKNMSKGSAAKFYGPGVKWLKNNGIVTVGAFVVGFPGETLDTVAETQDFIENSGLDFYFLQPFYYLHHTPIHKLADKYKLQGQGLFWSHETMDAKQACEALDKMFLNVKGSTFVNPDYTLWEIACLKSKGMDLPAIRKYRSMINEMTAAQMGGNGTSLNPWSPREPH
jgi:p-methyltransferase